MTQGIWLRLTHATDGVLFCMDSKEMHQLYANRGDGDGWVEVFPANEAQYMMFQGLPQMLKVEIRSDTLDDKSVWADLCESRLMTAWPTTTRSTPRTLS